MAAIDQFHPALDFALEKLGKAELSLKEAPYEALKSVVFKGKDTIWLLPIGYGKSLIYQLIYSAHFHTCSDSSKRDLNSFI